jgi:hypothetical protein
MPSTVHQIQDNAGIDWLAVVRILALQVLMFLGIIGATLCYLDWSSEAAWAEFNSASESRLADPGPEIQNWVQAIGQTPRMRAI